MTKTQIAEQIALLQAQFDTAPKEDYNKIWNSIVSKYTSNDTALQFIKTKQDCIKTIKLLRGWIKFAKRFIKEMGYIKDPKLTKKTKNEYKPKAVKNKNDNKEPKTKPHKNRPNDYKTLPNFNDADQIEFQHHNPKRPDTRGYEEYEMVKHTTTIGEYKRVALHSGVIRPGQNFNTNYEKGYITIIAYLNPEVEDDDDEEDDDEEDDIDDDEEDDIDDDEE